MPGRDHKKELGALYAARRGRFDEVDVPRLRYLAIDGRGDPSTALGPAMGAIFSIAYPLKFAIKARDPTLEYVVMPPEALYPGPASMYKGDRAKWRWTILVMQPVMPTAKELASAIAAAEKKGVPGARDVTLRTLAEKHAVQTLHVGPYDKVNETILAMHAFLDARGFAPGGPHHEIYLSDPHRVAPEKIKTILRQPVVAKEVAASPHARR